MTKARSIDINCDCGESFGNWPMGADDAIMPLITTANVACGFHGGDPLVMRKTVALAHENGVAVGAHPGLPDLVGFGRRQMDVTPDDAYAMVVYQVGALKAFLEAEGHGAPPRQAAWRALRHAARPGGGRRRRRRGDPRHLPRRRSSTGRRRSRCMPCRAPPGSSASTWSARSISTLPIPTRRISSSSARRRRRTSTTSRAALRRYLAEGVVESPSGKAIALEAETICVHGDGPNSVEIARTVRAVLAEEGVDGRGMAGRRPGTAGRGQRA